MFPRSTDQISFIGNRKVSHVAEAEVPVGSDLGLDYELGVLQAPVTNALPWHHLLSDHGSSFA